MNEIETAELSHDEATTCVNHSHVSGLIAKIEEMTEDQHLQIFQIIKNDELRFSHNQNGVFVNLANADLPTLQKIFTFVRETAERDSAIKSSQATLDDSQCRRADPQCTAQCDAADSHVVHDDEEDTDHVSKTNATDSAIASMNMIEKKAVGATTKINRRKHLQLNSKQPKTAATGEKKARVKSKSAA